MMKLSTYSFKHLLSGGLLCCVILVAAYMFQAFFPEMYVDAFSSSMHLLMWLTLFVGALLWTFREKGSSIGLSQIVDWQFIAAFILITADEIYKIMPKEIHMEVAPVLSAYTIPVLVVVGGLMACTIKFSIKMYQRLADERRLNELQAQKIQQMLDTPPSEEKDLSLVRYLIENKSIAQFTAKDNLVLVESCQMIDSVFFSWLKKQDFQLPPRDIILCVLIRMNKTKEEIQTIFCITDGSYRTMRSRLRKRLDIGDKDLEVYLQKELK